ncbi:MAG: translation elongation factor-like protein [Chloroflexi bacterium]|nr:translation elongation factor-like protein [Chloroflexota bacterium]
MTEEPIGEVTDFFSRPVVAAVHLTGTLKVGDTIRIKGHTSELQVQVTSMQIHNQNVSEAKAGDDVGIKVTERVRRGDKVYKLI